MPIYGPTAAELQQRQQQMAGDNIQQLVQFMLAKKQMEDESANTAWKQNYQNRQLKMQQSALDAEAAQRARADGIAYSNAMTGYRRAVTAEDTAKTTRKKNEAQAEKFTSDSALAQTKTKQLVKALTGPTKEQIAAAKEQVKVTGDEGKRKESMQETAIKSYLDLYEKRRTELVKQLKDAQTSTSASGGTISKYLGSGPAFDAAGVQKKVGNIDGAIGELQEARGLRGMRKLTDDEWKRVTRLSKIDRVANQGPDYDIPAPPKQRIKDLRSSWEIDGKSYPKQPDGTVIIDGVAYNVKPKK
jgi:hypothetical protein